MTPRLKYYTTKYKTQDGRIWDLGKTEIEIKDGKKYIKVIDRHPFHPEKNHLCDECMVINAWTEEYNGI